jgi:hypothetical protein
VCRVACRSNKLTEPAKTIEAGESLFYGNTDSEDQVGTAGELKLLGNENSEAWKSKFTEAYRCFKSKSLH